MLIDIIKYPTFEAAWLGHVTLTGKFLILGLGC